MKGGIGQSGSKLVIKDTQNMHNIILAKVQKGYKDQISTPCKNACLYQILLSGFRGDALKNCFEYFFLFWSNF